MSSFDMEDWEGNGGKVVDRKRGGAEREGAEEICDRDDTPKERPPDQRQARAMFSIPASTRGL